MTYSALRSLPEGEASDLQTCKKCGQPKALSDFEALPSGGHRGTCKVCRAAAAAEYKRRATATWKQTPAYRAHLERKAREREARAAAKDYARAQRQAAAAAAKEAEQLAERIARRSRAKLRANYQRGLKSDGKPKVLTAEQLREMEDRLQRVLALLQGTAEGERIETEGQWNAAMKELQKLWLQSGDKVCVACDQIVGADQMRPPSPANFYEDHCHTCASAASERARRATYGPLIGPLSGPRKMPMRDGTAITVAEFARRHRERPNRTPLAR